MLNWKVGIDCIRSASIGLAWWYASLFLFEAFCLSITALLCLCFIRLAWLGCILRSFGLKSFWLSITASLLFIFFFGGGGFAWFQFVWGDWNWEGHNGQLVEVEGISRGLEVIELIENVYDVTIFKIVNKNWSHSLTTFMSKGERGLVKWILHLDTVVGEFVIPRGSANLLIAEANNIWIVIIYKDLAAKHTWTTSRWGGGAFCP